MSNEVKLQDLLSEFTDALLDGQETRQLEQIVFGYDAPEDEVTRFTLMIRQLQQVFVTREPSDKFVKRLKQDLTGQKNDGLLERLRYLPARVQVAAGVAVVAGFMLITRRRIDDTNEEGSDIPALQQ